MWVSRGGYGRVGVAWWVWVSCGSARWALPLSCGGGITAWVAARFQALTSRFGSFTHGVGSGKVSRLSPLTVFFFFFLKINLIRFIYLFIFSSGLAGWVTILEELKLFVRG